MHRISKTGKYSDLIGTPTIGNGSITVKQNGVGKGTFTLNQTDGLTVSLTDTNYQLANSGTTLKLQSKTSGSFADSSEVNLATILANTFVNTSGDTMTGALTLSGAPTAALHAATKQYVDQAIADQVVGAAKFFGTFGSDTEFGSIAGNIDSEGDFARCTTTYESSYFGTVHAGDIVVCTNYPFTTPETGFSVIHGETYTMNSATADGYVAKAGTDHKNQVWKTDDSGNPAWRDDKDTNTAHIHDLGSGLDFEDSQRGGTSGVVKLRTKLKNYTPAEAAAESIGGALLHPVILDNVGDLAVRIPDVGLCIVIHDDTVHGAMTATVPAGQIPKIHFPQAIGLNEPETGALRVTFHEIVEKTLDKANT